jgi:hypothetical protein
MMNQMLSLIYSSFKVNVDKFRAQILNFVGSLASVLDTVTIHVF